VTSWFDTHLHLEPDDEAAAILDAARAVGVEHFVLVASTLEEADRLHALAAPHGYTVAPVAVRGCLHLKSAVTAVAPGTLLVNPDWLDTAALAGCGCDLVAVDPEEPYAANALLVPCAEGAAPFGEAGSVGGGPAASASPAAIYPDSFPRTRARLEARGVGVIAVGVSELQKAEGAVTCCSLVFSA